MINLILITLLTVFVIDLSGFVDEIVKRVYDKTVKVGDYHQIMPKLKPFTCSLCMSFWVGLIYLLVTHTFTLPLLLFQALLSFLTPVIGDFMMFIKDLLTDIITGLYKLFNI